jgi:hypothetical protein
MRGIISFRFSAVSSLRAASSELSFRITYLFGFRQGSLSEKLIKIKEIYQVLEIKKDPSEGGAEYPSRATDARGMSLEIRCAY